MKRKENKTKNPQKIVVEKLTRLVTKKDDISYLALTLSDTDAMKRKYLNKEFKNVKEMVKLTKFKF